MDFPARRSARISPKYHARRHLWLKPHEEIVCPNGHSLKHNSGLMEHDSMICKHREPGQPGECGARVYVLIGRDGRKFVAEVTVPEMRHMQDKRMSLDEALDYLQSA